MESIPLNMACMVACQSKSLEDSSRAWSQEYDEQDPSDYEDVGQDDGRSDFDTVNFLLDQYDDTDQKDDDGVKYGYDQGQESDPFLAQDSYVYYMYSEKNSEATEGDITSFERFDSYGHSDSDSDDDSDSDSGDDDRGADQDQGDSDYVQYESDSGIDSTEQDDDDFSDENGSDVAIWDESGDDKGDVQDADYEGEGIYGTRSLTRTYKVF